MSPLTRSLLALACAALLHASSADDDDAWRSRWSLEDTDYRGLATAEIKIGITDDKYSADIEVKAFTVHPHNPRDFVIVIPNLAKPPQVLVGEKVWVASRDAEKITLTPLHSHSHSPIKVHCVPGCKSLYVVPDQFVNKKLY